MKTKDIKDKIKELGLEMRISHIRRLSKNAPINAGQAINASHIRAFGLSKFIDGKGGNTLVTLIRDGKAAYGNAECSLHDSYNKAEGVKIATKRALAELNVPENVISNCVE